MPFFPSTPSASSASSPASGPDPTFKLVRPDLLGLGCVTGYGWSREHLLEGMLSGESAVVLDERLSLSFDRPTYVSRIDDSSLSPDTPLYAQALHSAVDEAVNDAISRGWSPGSRVGLVHCVVLADVHSTKDFYLSLGLRPARQYLNVLPSTPISLVMKRQGFHGPAVSVQAMCASGIAGLLVAQAWLSTGEATDVVVTTTDVSLTPDHAAQFEALGVAFSDAPPHTGCLPYQEGGRGFCFGEASVAMVFSPPNPDPSNNYTTRPYLRLLGGAQSHDGFHPTSLDPSYQVLRPTFRRALDAAGVQPPEVRYMHGHGPSTVQCDTAELTMLDEMFPLAEIYSTKPMVGHCQSSASLVELAATALGMDINKILASPLYAPPRSPRVLDGVQTRYAGVEIKSSLGLGGHNGIVVLEPPRS